MGLWEGKLVVAGAALLLTVGCSSDSKNSSSSSSGGSASAGTGGSGAGTSAGGSTAAGGSSATGGSGGSGGGGVSCGSATSAALAACAEESRLKADTELIAQPRTVGEGHWQTVQDLCADRFAEYGFTVERHAYGNGVNVIGVKAGTSSASEQVIVSAHYDSVPNCDGADDNASGVAGTLETARLLGPLSFERTLVVACWDEEEVGLVGARAYAQRAASNGDQIVVMTSLEMIGYKTTEPNTQSVPTGFDLLFADVYSTLESNQFRGDFVANIATDEAAAPAEAFNAHAASVGLSTAYLPLNGEIETSPALRDLRRSDHAAFWDQGYPAIMITDTSEFRYDAYHCSVGDDVSTNLDYGFMTQITAAQIGATADTLRLVSN